MTPGTLRKIKTYGNPQYLWSPHDEAFFPVKGAPNKRRDIVMYCCDRCGFIESYAPPKAS